MLRSVPVLGNGYGNKFVSDEPSPRNSSVVLGSYRNKSCFEWERKGILGATAGALFIMTTETRIDDSDATAKQILEPARERES
jgi:hypothetical protein